MNDMDALGALFVKLELALAEYYKLAIGLDLTDPRIERVDRSKISLSPEWDQECKEIVAGRHPVIRENPAAWGLILLDRGPYIGLNQKEPFRLKEGFLISKEKGTKDQ